MPSFLELLQSSSDDDGPSSSATDGVPLDVLASVKVEGGRRRRRRQRRNLVAGGVALLAVAVPAFALVGGDGDDPEDVRSTEVASEPVPDRSTDEERPVVTTTTSTTLPTEVLGVVIERTPEEAAAGTTTTTTARPRPTTSPTTPPATEPPLVCANSYDPACGNFSWSPAPAANQPMAATAPASVSVAPGETVEFDVVWSDPDAVPTFTDDDTDGTILTPACVTDAVRYGPWSPPAATGGSVIRHVVYTAPAAPSGPSDQITVHGSSRNGECVYDHYGSEGSVTIQVLFTDS
jgi:hypothetical protein